jgi:hypothetical protein
MRRIKRPIVKFLEKYFSKEELEEFLVTEKINKLERSDYKSSRR